MFYPVSLAWLILFSVASYVVTSARARFDWDSTTVWFSLAFIVISIGYSAVTLHKAANRKTSDRLASRVFLISISLGGFILLTRILFPIPSTTDNDEYRINVFLDLWLFFPFVSFAFLATYLATISSTWQRSLSMLLSAIFSAMFALSMDRIDLLRFFTLLLE
jgi:hypothetical protein